MKRLLGALLLLWLWTAQGAWAQPGEVRLLPGAEWVKVLPQLGVLRDSTGRLSIQEVSAPNRRAEFAPLSERGSANFGFIEGAVWLGTRLQPGPGAPREWLLEIAFPTLDRVDVFARASDGGGAWQHWKGGDHVGREHGAVAHRNLVFPLQLPAGQALDVYIRVATQGTAAVPLTLWRPEALWASDQATYAAFALYFGVLLGLTLYNLMIFASIRDWGFLSYSGFAATMAVTQAAVSGLGAQFIWPGWDAWNAVSVQVSYALAAVLGLTFIRQFLNTRTRLPFWHRALGWLMPLAGLVAVLALVGKLDWSNRFLSVFAVLVVGVVIATAIQAYLRKVPGSAYLILAWGVLLVGIAVVVLHNNAWLPSVPLTRHAVLIGVAAEMILLAFALADRMNVARRFKEMAQARLAAEHALVESLNRSQSQLKAALEERDTILEHSLVGIVYLNAEGRLRFANRRVAEIFGVERHAAVVSIEPFYASRQDYLQMGGLVAQAAARGESFEGQILMKRADARLIPVHIRGRAVSPGDLSQGTVWSITLLEEQPEWVELARVEAVPADG